MNTSITNVNSSDSIASRIRRLSATECAGLPDSTIRARNRSGWSVRISSGIELHGISPASTRSPATGLRRRALRIELGGVRLDQRHHGRGDVLAAGVGEVAGEHPHQLLQVADQRRVPVHLDAEVLERGDARRRGHPPRRPANEVLVDTGDRAVLGDVERGEAGVDLVTPVGVLGEPGVGVQALLDDDRDHRGEQPRVPPRRDTEVEVGQLGRLGDPRVDHDHRAAGVVGDRLQRRAGVGHAVALVRVLADDEGDLALVELTAHRVAEHRPVDQHLAALLLGDRAGAEPAAEPLVQRRPVRTAQVVALAAAAVIEDLVAAVGVTHRRQPRGHLAHGGVPVDLLERAVGPAAQRVEHPLATAVLVVVEAQRLLARVALRGRVVLVATDPLERVPVGAEAHLDAAVALAQDARRLVPDRRVGGGLAHVVVPWVVSSRPASAARSSRISSSLTSRSNGRLRLIRSVVTPARS